MTGRDVLPDAELFADLARVLRTVDPTPPHVYEQARRAHEHRQGAPVALPAQTPGGVAAPGSTTLPGHQPADGTACGGYVPSAAQTAGSGARSRGAGNPPHEVTQDPGPAPTR